MKIYLITGFLGSGKSTFLNSLLAKSSKKTGVLINEFGKISVDTVTLKSDGIDLIELKNGSIFCACLKDKFIDGLINLIKMPLDEIYIESSGLSDPSNMTGIEKVIKKQIPQKEFEFAGNICLIDAVYFTKQLDVLESVRRQITHSHFIVINKIDLADEKQVENIEHIIKDINPSAKIAKTSFGKIENGLNDINLFDIDDDESTNTVESRPYSMTLELVNNIDSQLINEFFKECSQYIYRAKGYITVDNVLRKFDAVNDTITINAVKTDIQIKSDELNKIVLLASKEQGGIRHISQAAAKVFAGSAHIRS